MVLFLFVFNSSFSFLCLAVHIAVSRACGLADIFGCFETVQSDTRTEKSPKYRKVPNPMEINFLIDHLLQGRS